MNNDRAKTVENRIDEMMRYERCGETSSEGDSNSDGFEPEDGDCVFRLLPSGESRVERNGEDVTEPDADHPNTIRTTRFTWLTWLPLSLFWQFRRIANMFFLLVGISCFAAWSPKRPLPVVAPFVLILMITALRDLIEDRARARDDHAENTQVVECYSPEEGDFVKKEWQDCCPGDVVAIREDEAFPADVFISASSNGTNPCFISTASLDGETNLKQRHPPKIFAAEGLTSGEEEAAAKAAAQKLFDRELNLTVEAPTSSLLRFRGHFEALQSVADDIPASTGVDVANFGLRGCILRNTAWVVGVVVYVGEETKLRLNAAPARAKVSDMHKALNRIVVVNIGLLILTCLYLSARGEFHDEFFRSRGQPSHYWVTWFWIYVMILYYTMPISLYVFVEFLKLLIGHEINTDENMRDPNPPGMYAQARTSDLVEELGQVHFLFSDKTGTLTANEMRFAWACIGETKVGSFLWDSRTNAPGEGIAMVRSMMQSGQADAVCRYFELLATCHTVQVSESGAYQGESPDEVALVKAAKDVGVELVQSRTTEEGTCLSIRSPGLECQERHIAQTLAFSSDRKRMSVIFKSGSGAVVFTKGADTVMQQRLKSPLPLQAQFALKEFARLGFRTLVLARRQMDAAAYSKWKAKWDAAQIAMHGRKALIEEVAEEAETGMEYIGITAMEDRLQERVPETIASLREADIRFWVLTGDKVETGVEIAKSCGVFEGNDSMMVHMLTNQSAPEAACKTLKTILQETDDMAADGTPVCHGLVIDGGSAEHVVRHRAAGALFYEVASRCSACVACRLSPNDKQALIKLVTTQAPPVITLAVGDGANDVPMIRGAHVGIGIRGKEGPASVQAADTAISQFRFLRNLLLVHGRRAYQKVALFLCFYPYKQWVMAWGDILYAHSTYFGCTPTYPSMLLTLSCLQEPAILLMIHWASDVSDSEAMDSPHLYTPGPKRQLLNLEVYVRWMLSSLWHGCLVWTLPMYLMTTRQDQIDRTRSFWGASLTAFTLYIIVTYLKLLWEQRSRLSITAIVAFVGALTVYSMVVAFLAYGPFPKLQPDIRGLPGELLVSQTFWICLGVVPIAALSFDVFWAAVVGCCCSPLDHVAGDDDSRYETQSDEELVELGGAQ